MAHGVDLSAMMKVAESNFYEALCGIEKPAILFAGMLPFGISFRLGGGAKSSYKERTTRLVPSQSGRL
jgi:hypothetical protein